MNLEILKKYAELLVKMGVNLQKGQPLHVVSDVSGADFVRLLVDCAYENGASEVIVKWEDEHTVRAKYLHASDEVFKVAPEWLTSYFDHYDSKNACYIYIDMDDPDLLKGVSQDRIKNWQMAKNKALTAHRAKTMANHVRWCVAALPSEKWARKMFPDDELKLAEEKLWDAIAKASRLDCENPIKAWGKHIETFKKRLKFMNEAHFKCLKYKNSIGTDVTVEMPEGHLWLGGDEQGLDGVRFSANIPTEEIFSAPKNTGVNGKIVSSMPLVYNGVEIDKFELDFKDGVVGSFKAEKNEEALKNILEMDKGASMLGEIALVPHDSPISNMNILFYSTLFDENAACHFALGKAYPCIEDSESKTPEELKSLGLNDSLAHVDFMIGTKDLEILGVKADGTEIKIFENGNFNKIIG